jgi:ubiquinone/menaquinone biosynthesis C-methylase UbiE
MKQSKINSTRGFGLLENFLAKKRAGMANLLMRKEHKEGRVLDIGCGTFPYFLVSSDAREKYGMDPAVDLKSFKNKKRNLILRKIKVGEQKLPFKDNFFDAITMLAVFEHIEHDRLSFVLKEIKRVLSKGGIFIITTPAPWSDKPLHYLANFGLISKEEIHEHKHNLTHKKIKEYLKDAGFSENKIKNGFFEFYLNMWFKAEK